MIRKYSTRKKQSKASEDVMRNYRLKEDVDSQYCLPVEFRRSNISGDLKNELAMLNRHKHLKISQKLFNSKFLSFIPDQARPLLLPIEEYKYIVTNSMSKNDKKIEEMSKSTSRSRYDLHCFNFSSNAVVEGSNKQKYYFCKKNKPNREERISRKRKKTINPVKLSKESFCSKICKYPAIKIGSNVYSKMYQPPNNTSDNLSKCSKINYSPVQSHRERYKNILLEVKKILKEDIISKRKLKYILKKQQFQIPNLSTKFRSSSEDDNFIFNSESKENDDDKEIEISFLKNAQSRLAMKARKSLYKRCINPLSSIVMDGSCKQYSVINENETSPKLSYHSNAHSSLSTRTPSPAISLLNDGRTLEKNTNLQQLSLVGKSELPGKISGYNFTFSNNLECANGYSKYFSIEEKIVRTPTPLCESHTNLAVCGDAEDSSSSDGNNINLNETFSFYHVSSSSQSRTYSKSLTPLRNASTTEQWSPIFLMDKNNQSLFFEDNLKESNINQSAPIRSMRSSSSISSSISTRSGSGAFVSNSNVKPFSSQCRDTCTSISFSTKPERVFRQKLRHLRKLERRSCSQSSIDRLLGYVPDLVTFIDTRLFSTASKSFTISNLIFSLCNMFINVFFHLSSPVHYQTVFRCKLFVFSIVYVRLMNF